MDEGMCDITKKPCDWGMDEAVQGIECKHRADDPPKIWECVCKHKRDMPAPENTTRLTAIAEELDDRAGYVEELVALRDSGWLLPRAAVNALIAAQNECCERLRAEAARLRGKEK